MCSDYPKHGSLFQTVAEAGGFSDQFLLWLKVFSPEELAPVVFGGKKSDDFHSAAHLEKFCSSFRIQERRTFGVFDASNV